MILEKSAETFLGGRVRVEQPQAGFRSGLDAVMLAAAIPARAGETALELGAGAGTASLCLASRVQHVTITGVEIDPDLALLAGRNAGVNGMATRVTFAAADVFALPAGLRREFDHVLVNPPFHGDGVAPPDTARARALKDEGQFTDWMRIGLQRTVSGGYFTAILRTDRLGEALAALPPTGISVIPLWPKAGEPAKRVILQVRKGSRAPFALLQGLVLHDASGAYSPEADAVLRCGEALALNRVAR
ncbi:MAG TPA: methyltransferase [Rhizomicrobium sp.]|jgi:tRNA1Val (adenine37-N6)-methyltransferase|nr:methyltransferase [Rhizomicrobium sp.]